MSSDDSEALRQLDVIQLFAQTNRLSLSASSDLFHEFEGDMKQAQDHLESRYRPAMEEWELLRGRVGFRLPFPVRIPLPSGRKIYHKLRSFTLARKAETITLHCVTQYLGKPESAHDGAVCSFSHRFVYLPNIKDLPQIYEHWAGQHLSAAISDSSHLPGVDSLRDPDYRTLHDFLTNKLAALHKSGDGVTLQISRGDYGGVSSIYLLSHGGLDGAIVTEDDWPSVHFDASEFEVGTRDMFSELPILDESPFEFATSDSARQAFDLPSGSTPS